MPAATRLPPPPNSFDTKEWAGKPSHGCATASMPAPVPLSGPMARWKSTKALVGKGCPGTGSTSLPPLPLRTPAPVSSEQITDRAVQKFRTMRRTSSREEALTSSQEDSVPDRPGRLVRSKQTGRTSAAYLPPLPSRPPAPASKCARAVQTFGTMRRTSSREEALTSSQEDSVPDRPGRLVRSKQTGRLSCCLSGCRGVQATGATAVKKEAGARETRLMAQVAAQKKELAALMKELAASKEEIETLKGQVPVVKSLDTPLKESNAARLSCAGTPRANMQTMEVESGAATSEKAPEGDTSVSKAKPVVKVGPPVVSLDCLARTKGLSESGLPTLLTAGGHTTVQAAPSVRAAPSTRTNSTRGRLEGSPPARAPASSDLTKPHSTAPFQSNTCSSSKVLQAATPTSSNTP